MHSDNPILLFDGVCNLCSGTVQFILDRDRIERLKFASLESEVGAELLQKLSLPKDYTSSLVLIENGNAYVKSSAALRVAKHMTGLWPALSALEIIPLFVRNPVYNWIARNRYNWFGKKEVCWVPDPKWNARFIDYNSNTNSEVS